MAPVTFPWYRWPVGTKTSGVCLAGDLLLLVLPQAWMLLSCTRVPLVTLGVSEAIAHRKAFHMVVSHLTMAVLHYGCATAMNARPLSSRSLEEDKCVSLIYINVTTLLYPAIMLQNQDVQGTLQRLLSPATPG